MDLGDTASSETCISDIFAKYTSIDVLLNNAGILQSGMTKLPSSKLDSLFSVNCVSSMLIANAVAEQMRYNYKGYIFNLASIAGVHPIPKIGAYSASKAAVVGYSKALFKACLHHNVRVTCLCPSIVNTDMADDGLLDNAEKIPSNDIVKSVAYLLSLGWQTVVERLDIHCKIVAEVLYPEGKH